MSILVDTNVLLRRIQPDHPSHSVAVDSVTHLLNVGEAVCFTLQNVAEFWNVATRPLQSNGLGLTIAATLAELDVFERSLVLLPDTPALYADWKRLVVAHDVQGVKVHDPVGRCDECPWRG